MEAQCSFIYAIAKLLRENGEHYKIVRCYIYRLLNMRKF